MFIMTLSLVNPFAAEGSIAVYMVQYIHSCDIAYTQFKCAQKYVTIQNLSLFLRRGWSLSGNCTYVI